MFGSSEKKSGTFQNALTYCNKLKGKNSHQKPSPTFHRNLFDGVWKYSCSFANLFVTYILCFFSNVGKQNSHLLKKKEITSGTLKTAYVP